MTRPLAFLAGWLAGALCCTALCCLAALLDEQDDRDAAPVDWWRAR